MMVWSTSDASGRNGLVPCSGPQQRGELEGRQKRRQIDLTGRTRH